MGKRPWAIGSVLYDPTTDKLYVVDAYVVGIYKLSYDTYKWDFRYMSAVLMRDFVKIGEL